MSQTSTPVFSLLWRRSLVLRAPDSQADDEGSIPFTRSTLQTNNLRGNLVSRNVRRAAGWGARLLSNQRPNDCFHNRRKHAISEQAYSISTGPVRQCECLFESH